MKRLHSQRNRRRAGLTLLELLLALGGTGFVAAAIATMLSAVSYGTSSGNDLRTLAVKHATLTNRVDSAIRASVQILAAENDVLVLWLGDFNASGGPNLSELRRIERDAASQELRSYTAPDGLSEGEDTAYELAATDFDAVTAALKDTSNFVKTLWANDVTAFTVIVNNVNVQDATMVSYRLTVTSSGGSAGTAVSMAQPRSTNAPVDE